MLLYICVCFHHILEKRLTIHRWFEVDPHHRLGCEAVVVQTVQTVAVGILQCAFVKDQETTTLVWLSQNQ